MISITQIESALVDAVLQATSALQFFTGKKDDSGVPQYGPINVFRGFLPLRLTGEIDPSKYSRFPFIIVQASSGEYHETEGSVTVKLLVGVTDDGDAMVGYQDAVIIVDTLIDAFYYRRIINLEYPLVSPLKWHLFHGSDNWPAFYAMIEAQFAMPTPEPFVDGLLSGGDLMFPSPDGVSAFIGGPTNNPSINSEYRRPA